MPSLTDSKTRQKLAEPPDFSLKSGTLGSKYIEIDGFLRLPSEKKDSGYRQDTDSLGTDSETEETPRLPDNEPPESHLDSVNPHQATFRSLEQDLKGDPSSISSWLTLVSRTVSRIDPTSKNAAKARADITISILDRALSAHPKNAHSKRLRLKYLRAGSEIWPKTKTGEEWEDFLKQADADIWMEWLEWRIGEGTDLPGAFDSASRILKALADTEDDEMGKVRVLWRLAVACQQAGMFLLSQVALLPSADMLCRISGAGNCSFPSRSRIVG